MPRVSPRSYQSSKPRTGRPNHPVTGRPVTKPGPKGVTQAPRPTPAKKVISRPMLINGKSPKPRQRR